VIRVLGREYGSPNPRSKRAPLDVLIESILSQNTNDVNREAAFLKLKRTFSSWEEVLVARLPSIEAAIRPAGLYKSKSRAIKDLLRYLMRVHGRLDSRFLCKMESAEALEELTQLKGIGVKTVSVALMFGCGRSDVFPVDTHILRVSKRLGLLPGKATAEKAHLVLGAMVPEGSGPSLHLNMIRLGREICRARRPMCGACFMTERCPWPAENPDLLVLPDSSGS
jgi:endonuclease-3